MCFRWTCPRQPWWPLEQLRMRKLHKIPLDSGKRVHDRDLTAHAQNYIRSDLFQVNVSTWTLVALEQLRMRKITKDLMCFRWTCPRGPWWSYNNCACAYDVISHVFQVNVSTWTLVVLEQLRMRIWRNIPCASGERVHVDPGGLRTTAQCACAIAHMT